MNRLTAVFKMLRMEGFVARQRFKCCGSCASAAISEEFNAKSKIDSQFAPKGFVFYHKQDVIDEDRLMSARRHGTSPSMMLRYGQVQHTDGEKTKTWGLPTEQVGAAVVRALKKHQIRYRWDGDPNSCIEVFPLD